MDKVMQTIERCVYWIVVVLTGLLVVLVSVNVFARYVLSTGILWAEEVTRLVFVWMVFLGAFLALCQDGHLAITFVTDRLPARGALVVRIAVGLLTAIFLGVVAHYGALLVRQTLNFGRTTPILGISAAWGYLSVPVSCVLMLLKTLQRLLAGQQAGERQ